MTATTFFTGIMRWRWVVIGLSLAIFIGLGVNAPQLQKNTSSDAFIDEQDPALLNRDRIEKIFNISDPVVVAIVNKNTDGIYNPQSLALVAWITEALQGIDNVDPDRVTSLATESNITGTDEGMEVDTFIDELPVSESRVQWIKHSIKDFPLYQGTLVGEKGDITLVVAELIDDTKSAETYERIVALLANAPKGAGDELHVAGEGAVAGYLSTYIDNDAKKLNPLAALIITIILLVAFRTLRGALLPNLIVILTAGSTIGAMAMFGVNFYVITNGLIVCMIGIAVADSVHIFSQYYEEISHQPEASAKEITLKTMVNIWQPITLTSFTTIAGFCALSATTSMPPIFFFGLFGALSVFLAWLFSMTTMPAILSMLKPKPSNAFKRANESSHNTTVIAKSLGRIGKVVMKYPSTVILLCIGVTVIGSYGASLVEANEERIENFKPSESIYKADKIINASTKGTYHLDIMVESKEPEGLYEPAALHQIEKIQRHLESLPNVGGTTSVVDYIKQMHKSVNENQDAYYSIPDDKTLIAQLFLLYSASADPTDFEEEIDGERRLALIRTQVKENKYTNNKILINDIQQWSNKEFSGSNLSVTVSGDINVSYHWIEPIVSTNLFSVIVCALAVIVMGALLFRSATAGVINIIPVALSILLIYGMMGFSNIWLGVGTSMFASIAIGLGVDFAVHTTHSMRTLLQTKEGTWAERLIHIYPTTGRAQFFNFLAIAMGFGALMTSDVPPLIKFGSLVAIAVTTAFLAGMILLPALAVILKPKFLYQGDTK